MPSLALLLLAPAFILSPRVGLPHSRVAAQSGHLHRFASPVASEGGGEIVVSDGDVVEGETTALTKAEVERVGNLVEDDEWLGLATELAIVMRSALRESIKGNVRDFTGKDDCATLRDSNPRVTQCCR